MNKQKYAINFEDSRTPTEIACKSLSVESIEALLQEKLDNIWLYAHYDIPALHAVHSHVCTSEQIPYGEVTKNVLENKKFPQIELVVSATKVVKIPQPQGYNSGQIMGNLIFRDKVTGKFHALNDWTLIKFEEVLGKDRYYEFTLNRLFSKLRRTAKVKSTDNLLQTVLFHEIYEALSKARGLSR